MSELQRGSGGQKSPQSETQQASVSKNIVIDKPICEKLAELRRHSGLTPLQLAKKTGVTPLTINLYENTYYENYELNSLRKIVEACGGKLEVKISY